jgi:hypothetical protein
MPCCLRNESENVEASGGQGATGLGSFIFPVVFHSFIVPVIMHAPLLPSSFLHHHRVVPDPFSSLWSHGIWNLWTNPKIVRRMPGEAHTPMAGKTEDHGEG